MDLTNCVNCGHPKCDHLWFDKRVYHGRKVTSGFWNGKCRHNVTGQLKHRKNARRDLVELLGGKCVICKEDDPEMLQIDHIYDDGYADRRRFGKRWYGEGPEPVSLGNIYCYYLAHPDEAKQKLQVLCANHNWKKNSRNTSHQLLKRFPHKNKLIELVHVMGGLIK